MSIRSCRDARGALFGRDVHPLALLVTPGYTATPELPVDSGPDLDYPSGVISDPTHLRVAGLPVPRRRARRSRDTAVALETCSASNLPNIDRGLLLEVPTVSDVRTTHALPRAERSHREPDVTCGGGAGGSGSSCRARA